MNMPQFMIGTFQNKNYHELFGVVDAAVRAGLQVLILLLVMVQKNNWERLFKNVLIVII